MIIAARPGAVLLLGTEKVRYQVQALGHHDNRESDELRHKPQERLEIRRLETDLLPLLRKYAPTYAGGSLWRVHRYWFVYPRRLM